MKLNNYWCTVQIKNSANGPKCDLILPKIDRKEMISEGEYLTIAYEGIAEASHKYLHHLLQSSSTSTSIKQAGCGHIGCIAYVNKMTDCVQSKSLFWWLFIMDVVLLENTTM